MADSKNSGQFGDRSDTQQRAREGGQASGDSFKKGDVRASEAGQKGAANQPVEAKKKGGENSSRGNTSA